MHVDDKTVIEGAVLVIEKGRVKAVGKGLAIPANAVTVDAKGMHIYPSFIDLDNEYGMPRNEQRPDYSRAPQYEANRKGAFGWNESIRTEVRAAEKWNGSEEAAKELRALGFGTVLTHVHDGIVRGTGAVVALAGNDPIAVLRNEASAHYSFNKGSSRQEYPSSLMGSISLLRQTFMDAEWYTNGGQKEERNLSLEQLQRLRTLPAFFEAGDKWNCLRADKVGDEFKVPFVLRGGGDEYQRIADLKATGAAFIVPLRFPEAWDVSDPFLARLISFEELKHWELAPYNAARLAEAGIPFALTSAGLQDKSAFLKNLRKAVQCGLKPADALRALTSFPAELLQMQNEIGVLREGAWANFFISTGEVFDEKTVIRENWIQGKAFVIEAAPLNAFQGKYTLKLPSKTYDVDARTNDGKLKMEAVVLRADSTGALRDTARIALSVQQERAVVTFTFQPDDATYKGVLRMAGNIEYGVNRAEGTLQLPDGTWEKWSLEPVKSEEVEQKKNDATPKPEQSKDAPGAVMYPFTAYGWTTAPKQETILFKNATIWTNEQDSLITEGQLLVSGGKIIAVGKLVDASKFPGVKVIDARGKHITAGIIDEHNHIATESVNEGGQASTAEVSIGSVLYPEDVDIYRQLSGGVTAAQILHGSANPIGGQSALIKMRWGASAEELKIKDAPGFIKFALGENVKQSNWGDNYYVRFPQTRMGVEQVYYDHFHRAREYGDAWKLYNASKKGAAPRRDIEMDVLLEILEKKRFITCHSYVQSEINMLMHVADSMGFKVNTFTHILEGYKLADKMKAHGANASSFSDWWAYKMEVMDAIPYNGALLWKQGINVAFNSDDAEMARRLNQEAAKAVKYGGVPETEALKFVTLNPAKMLHLDQRMGSLKAGKDADVVVWTDHPLSIYAKVEQTYVDGICYFDRTADEQQRTWMEQERARIIQKMLKAKQSGEPTQTPRLKERKHFHCDTVDQTSEGIYFKH